MYCMYYFNLISLEDSNIIGRLFILISLEAYSLHNFVFVDIKPVSSSWTQPARTEISRTTSTTCSVCSCCTPGDGCMGTEKKPQNRIALIEFVNIRDKANSLQYFLSKSTHIFAVFAIFAVVPNVSGVATIDAMFLVQRFESSQILESCKERAKVTVSGVTVNDNLQ